MGCLSVFVLLELIGLSLLGHFPLFHEVRAYVVEPNVVIDRLGKSRVEPSL